MTSQRVVTLDDVAREAGVSVSTASRTLNGRPLKVSVATQARVRAVAQRLGYATNLAAQATALGRSKTVGLIVSNIPDDYQNPVTAGIFRAASKRDLMVTTGVSDIADVERTRQVVRQLRGQRPSVLFVVGTEAHDSAGMKELVEELRWAEQDGGRVVLIGIGGTELDSVVVDDVKAGYDMASALLGLGYREFAILAGLGPGLLSRHRVEGFRLRLQEAGISMDPGRVIWQEFSHDGGYRAVGELLRRRSATEAVFCVNDAMAIGACVRFREAGVRVGEDIAVAGCDDIPALRDLDPPLTTMHLPWVETAETAFNLSEDASSGNRSIVLEGYPVLRLSSPGLAQA